MATQSWTRSTNRGANAAAFSVFENRRRKSLPLLIVKIAARNCTAATARNAARWRSITTAPFATSSPMWRNRSSTGTPNSPRRLGLLLLSPGWLTNQFVAGRRTRYLHPLRVYLLVSIVFFLCARFVPFQVKPPDVAKMTAEQRAEVEEAMQNPSIPQAVREQVLRNLAEQRKKEAAQAGLSPTPRAVSTPSPTPDKGENLDRQLDEASAPSWLKTKLREKIGPHGGNVELLGKTLRDNISTMMLFCIPLFAFVLKILYLRQGRYYIEHLVYALHIHSFFYIAVLLIVFSGIATKRWVPALNTPLLWILVLAMVAQVFCSIRQVYGQGWFMTTFKFFFGGFIYLFVLVLALAVTAVATLAFS